MSFRRKLYSPTDVLHDVKQFFIDNNHWVYHFGDSTPDCNPNSPYHRKQIEIIFEDKYDHWDVNTAVDKLIQEGFLRLEERDVANFVFRSDIRYYKRDINRRSKIIESYKDPTITNALGKWSEKLVEYMFKLNGFKIDGRDDNTYGKKKWTKTRQNLDFITSKDGIAYEVEVKNTLPYMEADEFLSKIDICKFLGLVPLWILRNAPEVQFKTMKANLGFILVFKSQIYPYGQEPLTREIWQKMRLPVLVRAEMPQKLINGLNWFHEGNVMENKLKTGLSP